MTTRTISAETARRLAISRQHLAAQPPNAAQPSPSAAGVEPAKGRKKKGSAPDRASAERLYGIVRDLGCVQLDPISSIERSHRLVMWSRAGHYDPKTFDALLFDERKLFEYWAHEASIVATEDYPLFHYRMKRYATGDDKWSKQVRDWIAANQDVYDHILTHLREKGAALSRELQAEGLDPENWVSSGWTSGRNVSRMLDFMWSKGLIMVSGRVGGQKQWDLTERVLPEWTPREDIDAAEVTRRAALKAIRALGVAKEQHIQIHFIRNRYHELTNVLSQLEAESKLIRVSVEGHTGNWYMSVEDVPLLEQIESGEWKGRTVMLSPFDNLLCDRKRTKALFNFEFTIEIYVPAVKRKYGYYVLPILHGDRLVGRIDPVMDRKTKTLRVNNLYAEPDAPKEAAKGIGASLESLATFVGAERIEFVNPPPPVWKSLKYK